MQPSGILESALYVGDIDAAEAFYGGILGLQRITRAEGRHVFFRCGEGMLLLFIAEATKATPQPGSALPVPPHGATGSGHLCFRAGGREIDRWKNRLGSQGIAVEADFEWPEGGRSIYFRDPFGNSLEFAEPKLWGMA